MITKFRPLLLILLTLYSFLITSCSGYHACALNPLDYTPRHSKKGFEVTAKAFSGRDSSRYLGYNLVAKGYQPIQIYLANNTNDSYVFTPDGLSLPTATPEEVAHCVKKSVTLKVLGGIISQAISLMTTAVKAVTFFTMAVAIALPIAFFTLNSKEARVTLAIVTSTLIFAPGILNGVKTAKINNQISKDYEIKTATKQTIMPNEVFNAVIFVPKDDVENVLSIKLINQRTEKILTLQTQVY